MPRSIQHMLVMILAQLVPCALRAGVLSSGDLLISVGDTRSLYEYSRDGHRLQSFAIPYPVNPVPISEEPRDVVVTSDGDVQVYNGTFNPYLSTLRPDDGAWSHRTFAGWSTVNNGTSGGIAASGNYVFATDMNTGVGDETRKGVVRFDLASDTALRFATTIDPIDLNIGLDGLLYVQYPGGSPEGFELEVYDPLTLEHIRQVFFGLTDHRAVAVNRAGEIYLADSVGNIQHFTPTGALINQINVCGILAGNCFLSDIDIAPDGALVAASAYGRLVLTDVNLANPTAFPIPAFSTTTTFVTFVPEPAAAILMILGLFVSKRYRRRN